jgi:hypothetical protein
MIIAAKISVSITLEDNYNAALEEAYKVQCGTSMVVSWSALSRISLLSLFLYYERNLMKCIKNYRCQMRKVIRITRNAYTHIEHLREGSSEEDIWTGN